MSAPFSVWVLCITLVPSLGILTGPMVHGDYVLCWNPTTFIVVTGSLCETRQRGASWGVWGDVIGDRILESMGGLVSIHNDQKHCIVTDQPLIIIATHGSCMISTNNQSAVFEILCKLADIWQPLELNVAATSAATPVFKYEPNTHRYCAFIIHVLHIWVTR